MRTANHSLLAAQLDERVVILDAQSARVMVMDARTERVWRFCVGQTGAEIAGRLEEAPRFVLATLRHLAQVGLIKSEDDKWTQTDVVWI